MAEATAVEPRGRISPEDLGIWSDGHAAALERTTAFISSQGSVPGIQLALRRRPGGDAPEWAGPNYQLPLAEGVRERNEPPLQYRRVF